MPDEFKIAKEYAKKLEQDCGERNKIYKAMEDLYWMRWPEEDDVAKQMKVVKVTRSPRARNALLGALRLLTATDPIVSVPYDINNVDARDQADKIEKFAQAMVFASGRIMGNPIHNDAVRSGLLYADVVIGITSTKELKDRAGKKSDAIQARLEEINKRTPYLFEVYNPTSCYADRNILGLTAFYRKVITTAGDIKEMWGEEGEAALASHEDKKIVANNQSVTLCDFYDLKNRFVWMEGYATPIKEIEHKLPFLPVAYAIAEGSNLFTLPEEQREPFLYTAYRSGVFDRENLILTTLYTMLFAVGANPMFLAKLMNPSEPLKIDFTQPGGIVKIMPQESIESLARQVIDPAMMDAWNIAKEIETQSTIYPQALGEPVSSSLPYSSYALMSQSGRLPLIATQRMTSHAIGEAIEIALRWMKKDNVTGKAYYEKIAATLSPDQIPEPLDIKVKLEIELPQDRLQMANAANMLAQGDKPLLSQRWVRENILNVGQSSDMDHEIWNESAAALMFKKYQYEKMLEVAQIEQAAMMPSNQIASGMPGSNMRQGIEPGGAMPSAPMPPNYGTPPQPNVPPGPQPVEPKEPYPPIAPNLMPLRPKGQG